MGHSQQVGLKTPFIDFVHPDDRPATMEELGRLAIGSETVRFENRYLTAAGDWLWISWTATPLPGGDLFYCVARDFTARRQDEQRLREEIEAAELANQSKSDVSKPAWTTTFPNPSIRRNSRTRFDAFSTSSSTSM
ncbi:MAG: PAS domain-containing protein [Gemmatimonadota bacterium]|nr:PAS domain-containing protein [Gemmatimonadota bacterium]